MRAPDEKVLTMVRLYLGLKRSKKNSDVVPLSGNLLPQIYSRIRDLVFHIYGLLRLKLQSVGVASSWGHVGHLMCLAYFGVAVAALCVFCVETAYKKRAYPPFQALST